MTENLILLAVFVGVLAFATVSMQFFFRQRELESRVTESRAEAGRELDLPEAAIAELGAAENTLIRRYFEIVRSDTNQNSVQNRLIRAGYFSKRAVTVFQILRGGACLVGAVGTYFLLRWIAPEATETVVLVAAMVIGAAMFMIANIIIDRAGSKQERRYRRMFPDFMDMLVVCLDAGMSVEASADRVTREFMVNQKDFGLHLAIMMLEVRGGRRLRDALANLADRLQIDEARSLAVLFRQSEELGSSVTQTLRVYSSEMREMRIIRAEEKANALPIKMLLPLGAFLFPISLIIVLVPVTMRVIQLLLSLAQ